MYQMSLSFTEMLFIDTFQYNIVLVDVFTVNKLLFVNVDNVCVDFSRNS